MKNPITKILSVSLALVLVLSLLPMAAFAAEVNECKHGNLCCATSNSASIAAIGCNHLYLMHYEDTYVNKGSNHLVITTEVYECTRCSDTYSQDGYSYYQEHSYDEDVLVGVDPTTGNKLYAHQCKCGAYEQ